jgi:hypothetical protein
MSQDIEPAVTTGRLYHLPQGFPAISNYAISFMDIPMHGYAPQCSWLSLNRWSV